MIAYVIEFGIIAALLAGVLLSVELGYRLGRWMAQRKNDERSQLGTIHAASLGILGLLIGFSYSGAANRFAERQAIVVREANAIGTAYLRADLLPEQQREALRASLRRYTDLRIEAFGHLGDYTYISPESEKLHASMWDAGVKGCQQNPGATVAVLPAINEVIDLHTTHLALQRHHLPGPILASLLLCAAATIAMIGYGAGQIGKRTGPLSLSMAILVAIMLWMTIDLDYPRAGIIRIDQQPMLDAARGMRP